MKITSPKYPEETILSPQFSFLKNTRNILWIYLAVSLTAIVHRWFLGETHFQNFLIFREATNNLFAENDLYLNVQYGNIQLDLFKYSPAFALLFAPFAIMHLFFGYLFWNLLNTLALFFALKYFKIAENKKWLILLLVLIDLLTSLQNSQSNGLMAALMIAAFNSFENKKPQYASWLIVCSVFIKLFSVVAFLLFLIYPNKRKFVTHSILAFIVFATLPLIVVSVSQLGFLYQSWWSMLKGDQEISWGISIMGILKSWANIEVSKTVVQLAGGLILCLPLFWIKTFQEQKQRVLFLSSILIWVIIFNHRAESNSFVIAMCGIVLWYFNSDYAKWKVALLFFSVLFISLSPTDLFPRFIRTNFIVPYCLKALPALIVWIIIQKELLQNAFLKPKLHDVK